MRLEGEKDWMRVAVGGLHTECSTFNKFPMTTRDFRILRGADLMVHPEFAPLAEFPFTWLPTLHLRAVPGGPIEHATYEAFKAEFLERLATLLPLDGLYLAMHGAANVLGMDDAEGDWVAAARAVVGPACPITASYDLHGNVSQKQIDALDMFSAYRTAPHIDVEDTKRRACAMLARALETRTRPHLRWAKIPLLLPGEQTSTVDEPAKSIYAQLPAIDARRGIWDASLMVGYAWADEPRATACAVVTGTDDAAMDAAATDIAGLYWAARDRFRFGTETGQLESCVSKALAATTAPVILAESGDNPTAGGVGDRAEVLAALLRHGADDALVAGIADKPATEACFAAGPGARVTLSIGATLDPEGSEPVTVEADILRLRDDPNSMERQAVIRAGGVTVVLAARRRPYHNIADFTALGLDPRAVRLLVVKSGYLSPELAPLANPSLMALTPGAVDQDLPRKPRHRMTRPIAPFDQLQSFTPVSVASARAT
jgi:microcystin degradation protein MlrC